MKQGSGAECAAGSRWVVYLDMMRDVPLVAQPLEAVVNEPMIRRQQSA
jgi:hypothetical protein